MESKKKMSTGGTIGKAVRRVLENQPRPIAPPTLARQSSIMPSRSLKPERPHQSSSSRASLPHRQTKQQKPTIPSRSLKPSRLTQAPHVPLVPTAPPMPLEPTAPPMPLEPTAPPMPLEPTAPYLPLEEIAPTLPLKPTAPPMPLEPSAPPMPLEPSAPPMYLEPSAPCSQVDSIEFYLSQLALNEGQGQGNFFIPCSVGISPTSNQ